MKKLNILLLAVFLGGCSIATSLKEAYAPKTADYVYSHAKVEEDKFYKSTKVIFPGYNLRHFTNYKKVTGRSNWDAPDTGIKPVAMYNDKSCIVYLYFNMNLDDWAFYSSARDENGRVLKFTKHDEKVNSGDKYTNVSVGEVFSIDLPNNFLTENQGKNPQIQVQGKRDNFRVFLPDYYIDGMLKYFADNNLNCK